MRLSLEGLLEFSGDGGLSLLQVVHEVSDGLVLLLSGQSGVAGELKEERWIILPCFW